MLLAVVSSVSLAISFSAPEILREADPVIPPWDFQLHHTQAFCIKAPSPPTPPGPPPAPSPWHRKTRENTRWVWVAKPDGTPPAAGWPVWISLVTDTFDSPINETCGEEKWRPAESKPFFPFSLPYDTLHCDNSTGNVRCPGRNYDKEAGAMWNQRLKQHLVANGVAVLVVNPFEEDSWDAGPWYWDSGVDKPFLSQLFAQLVDGSLGPLDPKRTVLRGYSSGAQMISWLFQVLGENSSFFPGVDVRGGVMLSGGSYQCYSDPSGEYPAQPIGSCKGCTSPSPNFCEPGPNEVFNRSSGTPTVYNDSRKCSSCNEGVQPFCGYCWCVTYRRCSSCPDLRQPAH